LASFLIHDIGAFHDLVDFERLLSERAEDIFSIIQHDFVHGAEARTANAAPSCFRALGSRKPTNCTIFCGCNSFLPEPSVFCCDRDRVVVGNQMRSAVVSFLGTHALPQDTDVFRTIVGHNRVQVGDLGQFPCAGVYAVVAAA
jgi:hypothetical protein